MHCCGTLPPAAPAPVCTVVDGHVQAVPSCRRRRAERVHAARRGLVLEQHFSKLRGHGDGAYVVRASRTCMAACMRALQVWRVNGWCPVHFHQYRLASSYCDSSRIYSQLATIAVAPISSMRGAGSAIGVATGAEVAICDACASAWQSDTDVAPVRAGLWLQREKSMARAEVVSRTVCVWTSSFQPGIHLSDGRELGYFSMMSSTETPSTQAPHSTYLEPAL